jgi:dienelactone hydrolase
MCTIKRRWSIAIFSSFLVFGICQTTCCQPATAGSVKYLPRHPVPHYDAQHFFDAEYASAQMEFAFHGQDRQEFLQWQLAFRRKLKSLLGLSLLEQQWVGYEPRVEMRREEKCDGFVRQFWVIWTEPTVPLPMIVLKPLHSKGLLPLIITPHGHGQNPELYAGVYRSDKERQYAEASDRNVAVQAVLHGYLVIAPTTRAFGETRTKSDIIDGKGFSCHTQLLHDIMVGRTPIGDRVWDMMRIIDWAVQSLPVDKTKIGISGNSGGGTVSLFTAACDERISVAVPSSCFCTFTGSIGTIAHCDCNYIPGILNAGEMSDIAGLIAPRPLCFIHGREDDIFPLTETRKAFARLKEIYRVAGVPDKVKLYVGEGGHRYYKEGAWPFFAQWFR